MATWCSLLERVKCRPWRRFARDYLTTFSPLLQAPMKKKAGLEISSRALELAFLLLIESYYDFQVCFRILFA